MFVRFQGGIQQLYFFQTHETLAKESQGGNLFFQDRNGCFGVIMFQNSGYVLPTKNHPKTLHLGAPEA